ncbi:hypothetical protein SODALDRAFT_360218 [Sodiomyces alkalinus F11]|uniref:Uncharacterized protein n=1 Tax=Sodiomyces alkalinus (strain CBS 110278 / VKM F-3762 / F11) TaxID=1314773 RepID=A0A3N2PTU2_SODAK|nr:hypothetical protein SODALDRAFT_360218 [Sodiomyces alkalinus F11]ROT37918.1 hypothetical protein SODALDRAFT_360218 [Sodiomyces alkalinus F11]
MDHLPALLASSSVHSIHSYWVRFSKATVETTCHSHPNWEHDRREAESRVPA